MNFLAHLMLSQEDDAETRLGNMLGDFVKGPARKHLSDGIRRGIELHQVIDAYTDTHPVFLRSKDRVSEHNRRFAGVLIDLFYDYFLTRQWSEYCSIPRESVIGDFYAMLPTKLDAMPPRAGRALRAMIAQDWLSAYGRIEGIRVALERMSLRLQRPGLLVPCAAELIDNEAELAADFRAFFPDLIHRVQRWRQASNQSYD